MRYSFRFDASSCTGCKSCQVACKDKNGLPVGVLWRRVYEVSGGTWRSSGAAWTNDVFAYNVSIGCNHCADPACASACPADAYAVRDDGIVWLDANKCIGCQYCAWTCPYGAPQYSPDLGCMTKCDFCMDLLDGGLPPACVAACPMRALDVAHVRGDELPAARHPFPLPAAARTRPSLAITPHPAMLGGQSGKVVNYEEVRPRERAARGRLTLREDVPLVGFTLLAQAAAGTAGVSWLLGLPLDRPLLVVIGLLATLATAASLFHLGTVSRAWRAPVHAKASALSREVAWLAVFGAAWVLALFAPSAGHAALAASGAALVFYMAAVYRIDAVPGWTRGRTYAAFAFSAVLLGLVVVLGLQGRPNTWTFVTLAALIAAQQVVSRMRFYGRRVEKAM